ncbi:MAG: ATP synthase F1 subunit gamma [Candidatus Levybacteria bacterium]|nr:ATP synthase F1 subunit gamma [Candidatus Levybacteria bacterium]
MANLLSLKRRIRAANNVSKTTRAMQMIATSKLKKAQDMTLAVRPYVEKLTAISQSLSDKSNKENTHKYLGHPEAIAPTLFIVISPDKGLCGGLIVALTRELIAFDSNNEKNVYMTIGKRIEGAVASLQKNVAASFKFGTTLPPYDVVFPIVNIIDDHFLNGRVGSVKILSTQFLSVFSQKPKITSVLPIEFPNDKLEKSSFALFEPSLEILLPNLLKHYLEMTIYQHLLESFASEQASRMIAMQNATDNAHEIVEDLMLEYNKGRQEKITNEILDIASPSFIQYE